jgi:methyl-accepting chemotaxis protein
MWRRPIADMPLPAGTSISAFYYQAKKEIPSSYLRLKNLLGDAPGQTPLADSLLLLLNKKIDFATFIVEARARQGIDSAQRIIATDVGKVIMNNIRGTVDTIIKNEEGLMQRHISDAESNFDNTVLFIVVGFII